MDTRRRVDRRELDFPGVGAVLRELAEARLVVLWQDTVEIAHEALIEAWPRLSGWLNADRDALRLHRRLTEDTRVWQALGRDAGALYRGARLVAWDGHDGAGLNAAESAFLAASRQRAADEVTGCRRRARLALAAFATTMVLVSALTEDEQARLGLGQDLAGDQAFELGA